MILLPRCLHDFDSYGHKQKRLDKPKINLNSRRLYTNFTYKPHIIKAILLTTKYTKEETYIYNNFFITNAKQKEEKIHCTILKEKRIQICEQNTTIYYDVKTPSIKADLKQQPNICCNY